MHYHFQSMGAMALNDNLFIYLFIYLSIYWFINSLRNLLFNAVIIVTSIIWRWHMSCRNMFFNSHLVCLKFIMVERRARHWKRVMFLELFAFSTMLILKHLTCSGVTLSLAPGLSPLLRLAPSLTFFTGASIDTGPCLQNVHEVQVIFLRNNGATDL